MVFYLKIICFIFIFELNLIRFGYKKYCYNEFYLKGFGYDYSCADNLNLFEIENNPNFQFDLNEVEFFKYLN